MTILVTGASGQLGTELCHLLDSRNIEYMATDSKQLDITNTQAVNRFFDDYKPDLVYDCAAYTAVDAAEEEPGKTINQRVNVDGTRNLAVAAERVGATLVYISTDYVFDGTNTGMYDESAQTNPKNEYGRAKRDGENLVRKIMSKYYIVRTSWVFGQYGKNFVYTMLRLAETHDELSVVDDQVGRPTWTKTLAEFMTFLIEKSPDYGSYQLSNEGQCSWYEFACEILKDKDTVIHPVDSTQFPQKAYRPKHSVMGLKKVQTLGFNIPSWQEALAMFKHNVEM